MAGAIWPHKHTIPIMDRKAAENIIETLKQYSKTSEEVANCLEQYDYESEAAKWDYNSYQSLMESEHPTLADLYTRLLRFISPIPTREDNIDRSMMLNKKNFDAFVNYLVVSEESLLAAQFNRIGIEPMHQVIEVFNGFNLLQEARQLENVYNFAYGIRKWYQATKHNHGATIEIKLELNYDEVTPAELAQDEGYAKFLGLFKKSCNYSTKQKRALYNNLKELYTTIDAKKADRTVMAVILLFRKPKTSYKQPFGAQAITRCKEKAMDAFGRDCKVIGCYSENSLESQPRIALEHVKRAEDIIKKSLEFI